MPALTADGPPPLPPGRTIGILGTGQLGRMLALAAARLGFRCHVFGPDEDRPAALVSASSTRAPYDDRAALEKFAQQVDVVTFEFENVPHRAATFLQGLVPVRPSPHALATTQDRFLEKSFLAEADIGTARFHAVSNQDALSSALADVGTPAVLKTRRFGYDGKGQVIIAEPAAAATAWAALNGAPAILEAFVAFDCEVSAIVGRSVDGRTACYDPARNLHERHILARSVVPAGIPAALTAEAQAIAERIVARLDYVGVMGVEMFVCGRGERRLLVNELAPRVHNSGHWTIDACTVSQFEQHIRAICGWPLGSTGRFADAAMDNLLGEAADGWRALAAEPDTAVHLYGKGRTVPGRKMGHVTRLFPLGDGSQADRMRVYAQGR